MSWQLWVLIALVAAGLVLLAVLRMRHARTVFDDITHLDRPARPTGDELAKARARHARPDEPDRRRRHG
ncbi:hypothetical protein AB0E69_02865 [Kribbella sp. NPDC026611]|uniref:hypothetical protein n=1 Tax=Kribbella sp. NPDC026611 TaxID=3154911 RepID=UPI0033F826E8